MPLPAVLLAALLLVALGVGTVSAQGGDPGPGASPALNGASGEVGIETMTNGQDADTPPGPFVLPGSPVTWTYVVTNYGSVALTNVAVSDDQGVAVTAPKAALQPGESMTATASGPAVAGQYVNVGTVTAELPDGTPVTASDPSHYLGGAVAPPVANFTANATEGLAPLAVQFTDASTGDGIAAWSWEFGDDGTSAEQHPVHVYTAPGNYTVNLTVTGPGGSDSEAKAVYVRVIQAAPAIDLALAVSADDGTTWHDAETAPGPSLPSTGPAFQFRFVVTNAGNVPLTDCAIGGVAAIGQLEPGASFTVQQNGTWAAGQQAVSATAYGYHGARAFMAPDTVYYVGVAPPVANFEANATTGSAPLAVEFTDASTGDGNRTRLWEFGDGETSTAQRPVHVYTAPGNYTVNLTVTGVGGSDGETKPDYITVLQDLPPIGGSRAYFLVSTAPAGAEIYLEAGDGTRFLKGDTGVGPLNVTLYLTAVPMRRIVANLTGYHDAVFEIAQYPAPGETVPVDLALEPIAPPAPVANFEANATDGLAPFAVEFTDTSTGSPTGWAWEFGDGATSSEQHPVHVYAAQGTYTVNLTVTGPGGSGSETKAGFITVRSLAGASEAYFLVSTEPAGAAIYLEGLGGTRYLQGTTAAGPLNVTLCRTCTPIRRIVAVLPGYLEAAHAIEAYPEPGETAPVHLVLEPGTGGPFPAPHVPSTVIQAEDFDTGGEGAAYHDAEPVNLGGAYRPAEGVDIETGNGVTNVGWVRSGEFLEYTVDTTIAGYFRLTLRAANPDPARKPVAVYLDGTPVTEVVVGSTGSWTSYAEVGSVEPLALRAGRHTLTLAFEEVDRLNLDWLLLAAGTVPAGGGQPFPSVHAVPGRVEAEDYDTGGFSDTTPSNEGGAYRADAVDIERGGSGYNVGWIRAGEYLQYSVDAATAGTYAVSFRVANPGGPKPVTVLVNGGAHLLTVPATGSFGTWQTATLPGVPLDAGRNTVRVETGRAYSFNLDYVEFSTGPVVTTPTPGPAGGASFTAAPATARAGAAVKFAVTPAGGKTIRSAWWSFDAPAHLSTWNSRAINPTFFYPRTGTFSPLVKLMYTDGSTETVHRVDYVRAT